MTAAKRAIIFIVFILFSVLLLSYQPRLRAAKPKRITPNRMPGSGRMVMVALEETPPAGVKDVPVLASLME